MEINLEKIDTVRERTGASYKEAKEALEFANGDVLDAIIYLESQQQKKFKTNISEKGNEIIEKLKEIVKKGNITRILIKRDDDIIINIPITAGAIGAVIFTPATITGILAALATGCKLEIVSDDGEVIDIKDVTEDTIRNVKEKIEETVEKIKNKE